MSKESIINIVNDIDNTFTKGSITMKKVLFTATVDSHIQLFHIPYLKYFKEKGYEVHVATNGDEPIEYCDKKHKVSFEKSPFKINNLKAIKQLKKIINEEKYDIIHTHTPMGSVVTRLAANQARKKYKTRVIYTAHGFHFYKGAPKKNWLMFYPVEKLLSRYTDDLITINKEDYNLAKSKFKTNVYYVPGVGIDESKFDFEMTANEKQKLRKSLGIKKDDFVMTYVARLDKNKNQLFLIEAMEQIVKKYKNIHLLLIGKDELNGYYQKKCSKKGLNNNIHFLGFREDIPKILKIANIAVASSFREGLPVNIMEAMYVGLPIVATSSRGTNDLIENNVNGFIVEQNDSKDLLDKINKIYQNNINIKELRKNSKAKSKEYLLKNILNEYIKIYNKKKIIYLRSTSIINDSRATKEINTYANGGNNGVVLGWNRQQLKIDNDNENLLYDLYNKKSKYGKGLKNIINLLFFEIWLYIKLKKYRNKFDIIHACDFDTAYIANKIAKKYNKKLIYDIYDYYVDCHNLSFLTKFVEKLDIKTINSADNVIICTEQRIKQISKCNPKKISIIHNSPKIINKKNKSNFDSNKIKVCYVGILQDDRLLIEISKRIIKEKNIELYIGGFGKYENYFKEISKKHKNIKYYGQMKYDEVLKLEADCDILFATYNPRIPNHRYSAPNKVYEAMSLGKPIIVCENTGVDEIVKKEKIGFIIDYDVEKFVKCINNITKDEYENISKTTKELYLNKYSWEIMEEKICEMINK